MLIQQHSGPIPSASEFREYESSLPGTGDRILAMAEKEGNHRREIETSIVNTETAIKRHGQWFAMFLVLMVTTGTFVLLFMGKKEEASLLFGGTLTILAGLFTAGKLIDRFTDKKG